MESLFEAPLKSPAESPLKSQGNSALDYRRLARRVRCRLGKDPIGKQRALAALARQADGAHRAAAAQQFSEPDSEVRAFAKAVTTAMEGPILRFSRRQELIHQAEKLGIRRFDANLLIAAVQHRLGGAEIEHFDQSISGRSLWRFAIPIGFAIALQSAILLGAWGLLHP
jgi:hypothetical protein